VFITSLLKGWLRLAAGEIFKVLKKLARI